MAYSADQADQGKSKKTFKLKYAELVEELENYEKCRMNSLKWIREFEQSIPYTLDDGGKKEGYVPLGKILKQRYAEESPDYILCRALRNSWMHNAYPWDWVCSNEDGRKEKRQSFDIDKDLKLAYLKKCCANRFAVDQYNPITLD